MDLNKFALSGNTVWVRYPETDVEFLVAYASEKDPRRASLNAFQKARRKSHTGDVDAEKIEKITLDMICNHLLKGWRGLSENGQPVLFTPENARRVMRDYVLLRDFVSAEAADPGNFGIDLDTEGSAAQAELKSIPMVGA